mmetsp:Transcript_1990/g.4241  ORF Transcript_1990/g.4241 Transcript_1990/m.4241 type:complete len:96 (-) Transcript_1990:231-518(-)
MTANVKHMHHTMSIVRLNFYKNIEFLLAPMFTPLEWLCTRYSRTALILKESTENGVNWQEIFPPSTNVWSIADLAFMKAKMVLHPIIIMPWSSSA